MVDYYDAHKIKVDAFRLSKAELGTLVVKLMDLDLVEASKKNKFLIDIVIVLIKTIMPMVDKWDEKDGKV